MSWVVIGDATHACLACDTSNQAFGPLHVSYDGDPKEELRAFAKSLPRDPRKYDRGELDDRYHDWERARQDD